MPENAATQSELVSRLRFRRADVQDYGSVWVVISECSKWLADQGLNHWSKYYTPELVQKMIKHKEVYLAEDGNACVGTITFDRRPPKYYEEEHYDQMFSEPTAPAGYIVAVGVQPGLQGKGVAGRMLQFTEDLAKQQGLKWLRIDCRIEVPGLVDFYKKRGFIAVHEPLDEGEDGKYLLMEKKI